MNNQKKIFAGIGIGLVLILLVGVFVWPGTGGNSNNTQRNDGPTYVVAPVERRTLSDEITVRGEMIDGYEAIQFPAGSGNWFYRDPTTGAWIEWR